MHGIDSFQAQEELDLFGFSVESDCYSATSTMLNSVPFSCHSALNQLLTASNAPPVVISQLQLNFLDHELCQTYCIYPLRQAGEDCHALHLFHAALSAACHTNADGTM